MRNNSTTQCNRAMEIPSINDDIASNKKQPESFLDWTVDIFLLCPEMRRPRPSGDSRQRICSNTNSSCGPTSATTIRARENFTAAPAEYSWTSQSFLDRDRGLRGHGSLETFGGPQRHAIAHLKAGKMVIPNMSSVMLGKSVLFQNFNICIISGTIFSGRI